MNSSSSGLNTHEFVTETLDYSQLRIILAVIVQFLASRGIENVQAEFGFVVQRDLCGEAVPEEQTVPLNELDGFIETGLQQGTIEWAGTSDFIFSPIGINLRFNLCNDADLHFASTDIALLTELSRALTDSGVKVYE